MTPTAVRQRLSEYAELARWAPSKHNTQPWRFVVRDNALEFWTDGQRELRETDPHGRERLMSLGAALHIACVAARAKGHGPLVSLFPDGEDGPVGRLTEAGSHVCTADDLALLAAVPLRRTDRGPLDAGTLAPSLPFELQSAASEYGAVLRLVNTPGDRATLARLVERADRLLVTAGVADHELTPWLRAAGDQSSDGVPSENTRGAAASYRAEFVQRDFSQGHSSPAQDRHGSDAPIIGILCTPRDAVGDWLAAGRALSAVLLRAVVAGAQASYLNQPVEVPALRSLLSEHLGLPGFAQLILRVGAGGDVAAPPRRADLVLLA